MGILVEESNVQRVDTPVTILSSKSRCTMAHSSSDRAAATAAAAAAATSTRGTFHDEYVLGHLIGQGAFGSVHKCWRRMDFQRQNPQEKQQQQQQLQQLKHPGGWEALPAVLEATGGPELACKVVAKSRRGALASAQAEIAALQRLSSSRSSVNSQGCATSHGREETQKLLVKAKYPNAAGDDLGRRGTEESLVGDEGHIKICDAKPTAMAARSGTRLGDEARGGETLNSQRGQHHHPCVLRLVDWFEDDNHMYIVTNLCRGGDLLGLMMRRKQQLHLWQQRQQQKHQQLRGPGCEGGDEGRRCHGPCQGEGLGDVLGGGLREDEARGVFAQLVSALALCHNMGLVHRDVKPGNIFVVDSLGETGKVKAVDNFQLPHRGRDCSSIGSSANGSVVARGSAARGRDGGSRVVGGTCSALVTELGGRERDSSSSSSSSSCASFPGSSSLGDEGGFGDSYTIAVHLGDFGLAKMMPHAGADGAPAVATATHGQLAKSVAFKAAVGSPFYRPPEMVQRRPYGPAADMWSLGVVLAQILTGTLPFSGSSLADMEGLASSIQAADVDFAAGRWAGVSEAARDVVRRLLCLVPEERMTAEEALQHPWVRGENKLLLPPEAWVKKRFLSSLESSSSSSSKISSSISSSSSSKTTTSNSKAPSNNSSSSSSSNWDSEDCGALSPKSRQHLCNLLQGSFSLSKYSPLPCALNQSRGFRAASMESAFGGVSVAAMFAGTGSHRLSVK